MLVKAFVWDLVISCASEVIARRARSYGREEMIFDPLHYLPLLEQKTNALDQAAPLQAWVLPEEFAQLRRQMEARLAPARTPAVPHTHHERADSASILGGGPVRQLCGAGWTPVPGIPVRIFSQDSGIDRSPLPVSGGQIRAATALSFRPMARRAVLLEELAANVSTRSGRGVRK